MLIDDLVPISPYIRSREDNPIWQISPKLQSGSSSRVRRSSRRRWGTGRATSGGSRVSSHVTPRRPQSRQTLPDRNLSPPTRRRQPENQASSAELPFGENDVLGMSPCATPSMRWCHRARSEGAARQDGRHHARGARDGWRGLRRGRQVRHRRGRQGEFR